MQTPEQSLSMHPPSEAIFPLSYSQQIQNPVKKNTCIYICNTTQFKDFESMLEILLKGICKAKNCERQKRNFGTK